MIRLYSVSMSARVHEIVVAEREDEFHKGTIEVTQVVPLNNVQYLLLCIRKGEEMARERIQKSEEERERQERQGEAGIIPQIRVEQIREMFELVLCTDY